MSQLAGKVALVTGGSRGIGAAIAKRLAHEGADVALTYVKNAQMAGAVVAGIELPDGAGWRSQPTAPMHVPLPVRSSRPCAHSAASIFSSTTPVSSCRSRWRT